MGRRLTTTYEVIDYILGKRLIMRTAESPFPMETIYTWESVAVGSIRMTLRTHGEPVGFSRFLAPLMAGPIRWANTRMLRELKAVLESRPA